MTLAGFKFKPKLWATIVTLCFVIIFVELGKWQLSRADERNTRHERLEELSKEPPVSMPASPVSLEELQYRVVEARGHYLPDYTIYLDSKTYKGHAGYHVITPLHIAQSDLLVAINRGWVSTGGDRSILPMVDTPTEEIVIQGTVVSPEVKTFMLDDRVVSGKVWDHFDLERYRQLTGMDFQSVLILQDSKAEDGLIRDWIKPESGASKNIGYAVQWFSLAAATIILFLILNVKRSNQTIQ